ncbi:phospholipid phosphatase 2-like isoform X2 [Mercenaria mercenaria]|uniref:phospholipid phosphatase 2-like isoform X2 n=1 Tax=Mercenaria mercenaria TaxID=6596 RepID=UPI001E1D4235|nr:phospholipid phosphatase 2-like isoform X2 [Mercenaria mercenaria]
MEKNSEDVQPTRHQIAAQVILDTIIWLSVALPTLFLFLQGTPYKTGFFCDDKSLSYPYKPDTVSTTVLIVAGCVISLGIFMLTEVLNSVDSKCRRPCQPVGDTIFCVKSCCVFLVGFVIQELVVEVVKNKMGVLRPNFFDVCKPSFNRTLCPGYIAEYTCTGSDYGGHTVGESRKSFPSGHAAFSMYIAAFFCIYIQKRLQIKFSRILKFYLQSGLLFLAILCGIGRVKDNMHHPSDVIAGNILGITVAIFVCKTIGQNIFKSPTVDILSTNTTNKPRDCCCSVGQIPDREPQTPSPLLPNEYFHQVSDGLQTSVPTLKPVRNKNTRTLTIPVKPIGQFEGV